MIWRAIEYSGLLSTSAFLRLEELVLGAFLFSIMYFKISIDSWTWLHLLASSLNCSWSEETLWRKRFRSTSYFSLVILAWELILASRSIWCTHICSSFACRLVQCRKSSFLGISWMLRAVLLLWLEWERPVEYKVSYFVDEDRNGLNRRSPWCSEVLKI